MEYNSYQTEIDFTSKDYQEYLKQLGFSYGNKKKLIESCEKTIRIYMTSDLDIMKQRIELLNRVIEIAKIELDKDVVIYEEWKLSIKTDEI